MAGRKKKSVDVLDALSPDEGLTVLRTLLRAHPDLVDEARRIATARLVSVDRKVVAAEVVEVIDGLEIEEVWSRSGRHAHGYVEPVEAAWEVLEEAIEPFTAEVGRLLSFGLEDAARAQCEGTLLGLHELLVDRSSHEVLQHAPDFLGEAAGSLLEVWMGATGGPRRLDQDLLHDGLYEWVEMVGRVERQAKFGKHTKRR